MGCICQESLGAGGSGSTDWQADSAPSTPTEAGESAGGFAFQSKVAPLLSSSQHLSLKRLIAKTMGWDTESLLPSILPHDLKIILDGFSICAHDLSVIVRISNRHRCRGGK